MVQFGRVPVSSWRCSVVFPYWWRKGKTEKEITTEGENMRSKPLLLFFCEIENPPLSHRLSRSLSLRSSLSLLSPWPFVFLSFTPWHKKVNIWDGAECYCTDGILPACCEMWMMARLDSAVGVLLEHWFQRWIAAFGYRRQGGINEPWSRECVPGMLLSILRFVKVQVKKPSVFKCTENFWASVLGKCLLDLAEMIWLLPSSYVSTRCPRPKWQPTIPLWTLVKSSVLYWKKGTIREEVF